MLVSFHNDDPSSNSAFQTIVSDNLLERVKALDARVNRKGLAALDPARNRLIRVGMESDSGAVTRNGYGVFNLSWQSRRNPEWPTLIDGELDAIRQRIFAVHQARLRFLIWVGQGGSAEDKNAYQALGLLKGGPRCYVLDSADPAKLKSILADITRRSRQSTPAMLKSTLVVGITASQTSYEPVLNLEKLTLLFERYGIDPRPNLYCISQPGSLLHRFAAARGYRTIEPQLDGRNTTASHHSAPLSRGSLYPLGLAGCSISSWIEGAALTEDDIQAAWRLSAFLHSHGVNGRDKVTLMLPADWAGTALWTKQDFEQSLGNSERWGIMIVIDEKVKLTNYRSPRDPSQDRVFLVLQIKGVANPGVQKLALLRRSGYPVATLGLPRGALLSRYMQFIHYVVFGIAYLRDLNFLAQPGVELCEAHAGRLVASARKAGALEKTAAWRDLQNSPRQAKWRGRITLHFDRIAASQPLPPTAPQILAILLSRLASTRQVEYGELAFFGDTRYSERGRAVRNALHRAGEMLFRARFRMPVDIGEGPAFNHSCREMIVGHGKCFSVLLISETSESLPEIGYTADYHRAQFLAALLALSERKRPVVALTLKDLGENTLSALQEFFRQTARHVTL